MNSNFLAIISVVFLFSKIYCTRTITQRSNYVIYCDGNCGKDAAPKTLPGVVLMGGGTDTDEAFLWQLSRAGGGDFVVLRASGDDAYNPYIYDLSVSSNNTLNTMTTVLMKNRDASAETEVLDIIRSAEAIFMAGGDQSDYLNYWVGTEVQTILQSKLSTVTIGGTSAGCMVLGNWVYSADKGSVTSDEALNNPYHRYITIAPAFLKIPYLDTVLTDTHFVTRDRMGRMLTFNARILADSKSTAAPVMIARSVGIDEHTALLLDVATGDVAVVGVNTAYVCIADHQPTTCKSATPLTFRDLSCARLSAAQKDTYSFATWSGKGAVTYTSSIVSGKFTNLPYGPVSQSDSESA